MLSYYHYHYHFVKENEHQSSQDKATGVTTDIHDKGYTCEQRNKSQHSLLPSSANMKSTHYNKAQDCNHGHHDQHHRLSINGCNKRKEQR